MNNMYHAHQFACWKIHYLGLLIEVLIRYRRVTSVSTIDVLLKQLHHMTSTFFTTTHPVHQQLGGERSELSCSLRPYQQNDRDEATQKGTEKKCVAKVRRQVIISLLMLDLSALFPPIPLSMTPNLSLATSDDAT